MQLTHPPPVPPPIPTLNHQIPQNFLSAFGAGLNFFFPPPEYPRNYKRKLYIYSQRVWQLRAGALAYPTGRTLVLSPPDESPRRCFWSYRKKAAKHTRNAKEGERREREREEERERRRKREKKRKRERKKEREEERERGKERERGRRRERKKERGKERERGRKRDRQDIPKVRLEHSVFS
jgi:hypothetical protein